MLERRHGRDTDVRTFQRAVDTIDLPADFNQSLRQFTISWQGMRRIIIGKSTDTECSKAVENKHSEILTRKFCMYSRV